MLSAVGNLVMEELEEEAMKIAKHTGFAARSGDIYVDVEYFLEHLNEQDPNIRFTTEEELNNELPFLDVRVACQDGKLRTHVHRKKTDTDRLLFFKSHQPISAKRSAIGSLFSLIDSHVGANDIEEREKKKQHLFEVLKQNNHPRTFIGTTLHRIDCKKERVEILGFLRHQQRGSNRNF